MNSLKGKFSSTGGVIDDKLVRRGRFVVARASGEYTSSYQSFGKSKETWNEQNRVGGRVQLPATPTENVSNRLIVDKLRSDERTKLSFQWSDGPTTWADGTPRTTSYLRKFAEGNRGPQLLSSAHPAVLAKYGKTCSESRYARDDRRFRRVGEGAADALRRRRHLRQNCVPSGS